MKDSDFCIIVDNHRKPMSWSENQLCYCDDKLCIKLLTIKEAKSQIIKSIKYRKECGFDIKHDYHIMPVECDNLGNCKLNRVDSDRIRKYFVDCIYENIYIDDNSLWSWLQSEGLAEREKTSFEKAEEIFSKLCSDFEKGVDRTIESIGDDVCIMRNYYCKAIKEEREE
jgi:hypothetical protein